MNFGNLLSLGSSLASPPDMYIMVNGLLHNEQVFSVLNMGFID